MMVLMAIPRKLRGELQKKFSSLSRRRVNQIIGEIQEEYNIIDRDIAVYVLAHKNKIKLKNFLDASKIKEVQEAMKTPAQISVAGPKKNQSSKYKKKSSPQIINFGNFQVEHPIIPRKLTSEAKSMSNVYPIIYVFENSVRNFILKVMEKAHGSNWWDKAKISTPIKKKVLDRKKKEHKNRWHDKRGAHSIFYTDIDDLSCIITNNWPDFENHFPTQSWIQSRIEIIEQSRNVISHNNPLSKDDIASVEINFKQWVKQVKNIKI